jgi:AbrB family looped-hinge helix DNA binding protein
MAKVTSKLQVTIPKAIAVKYGIKPGDRVEFVPRRDGIQMVPPTWKRARLDVKTRLEIFDATTERIKREQAGKEWPEMKDRGWTREDAYEERLSRYDRTR